MNRKEFLLSLGASVVASGPAATGAARPPGRPDLPRPAVIPAALTPIDEGLQIDFTEFRRHIAALAGVPGVSAIMVNGAAGHDSTLTRDERRRLLAAALAASAGRTPILAAVRENREERSLAPFAQDAAAEGAHAIVVMPPADKSALAWDAARARFEPLLAATSLPIAIYHTGYDTETLTRLASLPPVFAVKEGSETPAVFERNLRALRALGRGIAVWSTHSSWLLADLAMGADGLLSGMGSVAADLQVALARAIERSDLTAARQVSDRLFPLTQAFYRPGQDAHTRMLYALKKLGRIKHDFVRPPRQGVGADDRARIDRALAESGLR